MTDNTMNALLRSALYAGLASGPLLAAAPGSPDSGVGGFWALILGLMLTMFGGMAFCYGLVKLAEKAVQMFQTKHVVPASAPSIRRAA